MHIGDLVKKVLKETTTHTVISKKLDISRPTLDKYLKMADMPLDFVIKIGNAILYDFTEQIPQLKAYARENDIQIYIDPDKHFMIEYSKEYYNLLVEYDALEEFTSDLCKKYNIKI